VGTYLGTALVQVVRDGQVSNTISVNMAAYAPGIVVVTDTSYNLVDATHPAKAGQTLVFWALGLGATNPAVGDGAAAPGNPPANVMAPVTVEFGLEFFIYAATPSFAGLSPGGVGLYQVIVTLPASTHGARPGRCHHYYARHLDRRRGDSDVRLHHHGGRGESRRCRGLHSRYLIGGCPKDSERDRPGWHLSDPHLYPAAGSGSTTVAVSSAPAQI
jgi:hypothetical protein